MPFWPGRYVPDIEELKALEEKWKLEGAGARDEEKATSSATGSERVEGVNERLPVEN